MKSIKLISIVLVVVTMCCIFVACDSDSYSDIELPERPFYDITVSFQIANGNGKVLIDAVDYNYKGHEEPTILNIISDYLAIEEDWKCTIDKNNTLVQVGGVKASTSKGEYWAFQMETGHDIQALLVDPKKGFLDARMSDYTINDGESFTIALVQPKDD